MLGAGGQAHVKGNDLLSKDARRWQAGCRTGELMMKFHAARAKQKMTSQLLGDSVPCLAATGPLATVVFSRAAELALKARATLDGYVDSLKAVKRRWKYQGEITREYGQS
jgi:hypothetical protein